MRRTPEMCRPLCAVLLLTALLTPAGAQVAPVKPEPGLPESGLSIAECLTVADGLAGLDGRQELTRDNQAVQVNYKFENARLRMTIQENLSALADVRDKLSKVTQVLFREEAGDQMELKPGTPEYYRYTMRVAEAQKLPCRAQLSKINVDDLRLDRNEIPGTVLGNLSKILEPHR